MEKQFNVEGMTCSMCQLAVEETLNQMDGVLACDVNLMTGQVRVELDHEIDDQIFKAVIEKAGYTMISQSKEKELILTIEGMSCAMCQLTLEQELSKLVGVKECVVNLLMNQATVRFDPAKIKTVEILEAIERVGFKGSVVQKKWESTQQQQKQKLKQERNRVVFALLFALMVMVIAMGPMMISSWQFIVHQYPLEYALVQFVVSLPVLYLGRGFYVRGIKNILHKVPNMDSLVAIGTLSALLYSGYNTLLIALGSPHGAHHLYFESATMILAFILLGKYLELRSKGQTSQAIEALLRLKPNTARLLKGGQEIEVELDELRVGDLVVIKPGDKVSVDGLVVEGHSVVDESMLTGESLPIEKQVNDQVIMGTLNSSGRLVVKVMALLEETTLSKMIDLVQQAQTHKAPIAKMVDKISRVFVPVVMVLATLTFIGWFLITRDLEKALIHFVSVMVIACPCALGLATPTAIMVATGQGAKQGIFIKSAEVLEMTSHIDLAVFDKTGTLTQGKPVLQEQLGLTHEQLQWVASVEHYSQHPLAQAIVEANEAELLEVVEFKAHHGQGVSGIVEGHLVEIGNQSMMESDDYPQDVLIKWSKQGHTVMIVRVDHTYVGMLAVSDQIKPQSKQLIQRLNQLKIDTVMLTGDQQFTAQAIASEIGVSQVIAEVLPTEKGRHIESFQKRGHTVLMVGDGINDALALVQSDIGIAIGTGTDVAIESADIVLMRDNMLDVETAIRLSRATMKNIRQNLFWAFIYNVIGIPLAMGLFELVGGPGLNPMVASLAMAFSSISVMSNALRLRKFK